MSDFAFEIQKKIPGTLGRAGIFHTPHGDIETPAFVTVGTKGTVKAITPEQVRATGAQVVLANTYHLYLQPGDELVCKAGGIHQFMGWDGPTMTDSGGFQVFSLGTAYGTNVTKIASSGEVSREHRDEKKPRLAKITEEGVFFRSHIDGSEHKFTPEKSMDIQHNIGADIMFAFDECTSPHDPREYQQQALERTHRWAERSLAHHRAKGKDKSQALFGIVQGGRYEDLRKKSAHIIGAMDFAGFGIGGSFVKTDMDTAVGWVNTELPEEKPRHLLGIGDPKDLRAAIGNGCDLFDCVAPTRIARNGMLYVEGGTINILNSSFRSDFSPVTEGCGCYTCTHYTRAYLAHLFRAREMLAATLASIHNVYFIVHFVKKIRQNILDGKW